MMRPPPWNKHEAAILLAGLLSTIEGNITRAEAIKNISQDLRNMAISQGLEIDSVYRNKNGISFQLQSMESAYYGHTVFKPATKLFTEVATIYHESQEEYQELLKEAVAMINKNNSVEDDFMQYLAAKVTPAQLSALYPCYAEIESFCLKIKVLQSPLFQTTDFATIKKVQRTIEQNKIFRITRKKQHSKIVSAGRYYYTYIKEGHNLSLPSTSSNQEVHCTPDAREDTPDNRADDQLHTPVTRNDQDERLLQKYPDIYHRIYTALNERFSKEGTGLSIGDVQSRIGHSARPAIIEEILDNVSWASTDGRRYIFSREAVDHSVILNEPEHHKKDTIPNDETVHTIDFNGTFDLAYTRPETFSYFGSTKPAGTSWTALYVNLIATIIDDYPHVFNSGMSFSNRAGRIELADQSDCAFMIAPKPIPGTNYMLETNISASDTVRKIKYILDLCSIDYENIEIKYSQKASAINSSSNPKEQSDFQLTPGVINSSTFSRFLAEKLGMADATCRSYSSAIKNCETFAQEHHFTSIHIYTEDPQESLETIRLLMSNPDFMEYNAKQHNRFRAALQKFLIFIGRDTPTSATATISESSEVPYQNELYEAVLSQYFKKGFRLESPLEIRKFRRYYTAIHNSELKDTDECVSDNIKSLCIVYDGKAFLPDVMLSEELKTELFSYIDTAFASGKAAIYYQALYTEFADAFLDYHIHDAEMLKAYLTFVGHGRYYINRSFISCEPNVTLDALSEIRSCLQEYGRPVEYDELFSALPHLPQSKIKFILASNQEFVNNGHGAYFHESIVKISDEEMEGISEIIRLTIADKEFMGGNELYDAIKAKYPYIIDSNHNLSVYGFRDALKVKLGDSFSFKGNIISRFGQELSMADVFAKYAKSRDNFTLSELQGLASNLATTIYFDSIYENSLRVSRDLFVSKDAAQFSISDTEDSSYSL